MGEQTKIQWTDHTFNPWIGCAKVHTGCAHCYAEADMDHRRGRVKWGPHGTRSGTTPDYSRKPIKWNREAAAAGARRRVFCASLADVFEDWAGPLVNADGLQMTKCGSCGWVGKSSLAKIVTRPGIDYPLVARDCGCDGTTIAPLTLDDLRRDLFRLIDATPSLDWLLLTKRPENVRRMWPAGTLQPGVARVAYWNMTGADAPRTDEQKPFRSNIWLLTSVSDQPTADAMIPPLLKCRDLVPVLGLSCEPLLGPVDLEPYLGSATCWNEDGSRCWSEQGIDWVIVGGESGGHSRPCDLAWIRSIVQQCKAAEVPCFVKQLGAYPMLDLREDMIGQHPTVDGAPSSARAWARGDFGERLKLHDGKGGDVTEWPADLWVREFPPALSPRPTCNSSSATP